MTDPITTPAQMREAAVKVVGALLAHTEHPSPVEMQAWSSALLNAVAAIRAIPVAEGDDATALRQAFDKAVLDVMAAGSDVVAAGSDLALAARDEIAHLRRQLSKAALDCAAVNQHAADAYWAAEKAEAERGALKAEAARLRRALEWCPPDRPQMSDAQFRDAVNNWWRLRARPALKGGEDG